MLPNLDFLLSSQSHLNDLHIVTYIKDPTDKAQLAKFKTFRKLNQTNQNELFHYHYWLVSDDEIAH